MHGYDSKAVFSQRRVEGKSLVSEKCSFWCDDV